MKPFYSIDELEDLLELDELEIADGLKASGVPMIYNGCEADLSEWYARRVTRAPNGSIRIVMGQSSPLPSSDDVKVSVDALPDSWKVAIQAAEKSQQASSFETTSGESSQPDWSYWTNMAGVSYAKACALSLNISPGASAVNSDQAQELRKREEIASTHLQTGNLQKHALHRDDHSGSGVLLAEFRVWGESLPQPFTFPDEFPRAASETQGQAPTITTRWPWGEHETALIRMLAAAAEKFWRLYNPADRTTAPTNETVAAWLKEQGVADRNAQVMATILRADNLPTGPRK